MENKRKKAIEEYSESIKGQFDYTVESAHITGFMVGYDTFDKTNLSMTAESIDEIIKKPLSKDEVDKINNLLEDKMRLATQKELLERVRDDYAYEEYKFMPNDLVYNCGEDLRKGFDKGAEEMAKMLAFKDAQIEGLVKALSGILEIGKRDMSNPKYDGYFETATEALENFRSAAEGSDSIRKEVK